MFSKLYETYNWSAIFKNLGLDHEFLISCGNALSEIYVNTIQVS